MEKIKIANELLKNTTKKDMQKIIKEYIKEIQSIEQKSCKNEELIRLDNCVNYIKEVNFSIIGWMLFEIPIFYSHCFLNKNTKEAFDLVIWDIGEVIPRYLDSESNEQDAKTIQEAIKKYYNWYNM